MVNERLYSAALLREEHTKILRRWTAMERQHHASASLSLMFGRYLERRRKDLDKEITAAKKGKTIRR